MLAVGNKKNLFYIIIIFIIIVFALVYFYYARSDNQYTAPSQDQLFYESDVWSQEDNNRAKDVEVYNMALEQKNLSSCEEIKDLYTRDLCFERVAVSLSNQSTILGCQNIENNEEKEMCNFTVYKTKAIQEKSIEPCNKLILENLIKRCIEQVESSNFCADEECYEEFYQSLKGVDSDKDGLLDLDEMYIYQSDPENPDTDGDGYSDGDEIKNGYNPLGAGKL